MFKTALPKGQPRSLRTLAETNDSKNLLAPAPPEKDPVYRDDADGLKFTERRDNAAGKRPFK